MTGLHLRDRRARERGSAGDRVSCVWSRGVVPIALAIRCVYTQATCASRISERCLNRAQYRVHADDYWGIVQNLTSVRDTY